MRELKTRFIDDIYVEYYNTGNHDLAQVYIKSEVDATIAELKDENRKLKRALWLARAEKAHKTMKEYWPDYCHNAHSRIALQKWENVERKCRAKAEEYK